MELHLYLFMGRIEKLYSLCKEWFTTCPFRRTLKYSKKPSRNQYNHQKA
jgi:hypothetical protein